MRQLGPISIPMLASLYRRHAALTYLVHITRDPAALSAIRSELADVDHDLAEVDRLIAARPDAADAGWPATACAVSRIGEPTRPG